MNPLYKGYLRVASAVPAVTVGDTEKNIKSIGAMLMELDKEGVELAVFPEMCITAYTCADLFHNFTLLESADEALRRLMAETCELNVTYIVGLPVLSGNALYNCAAVVSHGKLLALVPKTYIPNYNEFYEKRWWHPAPADDVTVEACGQAVTMGTHQLIEIGGVRVGVEICEDLWTALPPSTLAAMAGAEIIVNLSASDSLIGKRRYLEELVQQQSARTLSAYIYASAGFGESSTDLVFDGIAIIAENGRILNKNKRWEMQPQCEVADIDLQAIRRDRMHITSYADAIVRNSELVRGYNIVKSRTKIADKSELLRKVSPNPFVPEKDSHLRERCEEIINIQVAGLCKRLAAINCRTVTIGISGGLDSTLALLVSVRAFDRLGIDRRGVVGVTMPGFGTTGRTHNNAVSLMEQLGVTVREVRIDKAVIQHFADIGHDMAVHDVTYENSQARERTQILMDIANQTGGIVIGTGDLSELALGWATYNGDHISMYGVNSSVPKTLVKYLVESFGQMAKEDNDEALAKTLADIVDTPVSPELIPADAEGNIVQKTEDLVGPYQLHDFYLYYMLRYGFSPTRIYALALKAFEGKYEPQVVKHWLKVFMRRFFAQQFKRSCLPDGPKVGSVCLSPRGDWRMPSDASSALWLAECEAL